MTLAAGFYSYSFSSIFFLQTGCWLELKRAGRRWRPALCCFNQPDGAFILIEAHDSIYTLIITPTNNEIQIGRSIEDQAQPVKLNTLDRDISDWLWNKRYAAVSFLSVMAAHAVCYRLVIRTSNNSFWKIYKVPRDRTIKNLLWIQGFGHKAWGRLVTKVTKAKSQVLIFAH